MRIVGLAAAHFLAAHLVAQRNRILAYLALILLNGHFAARARFHRGRQQFAAAALAHMANVLALVVVALQYRVADAAARKPLRLVALFRARNRPLITRAVAHLFRLLVARITIVQMAFLLAPMRAAAQQLITLLITADYLSLIALVHLGGLAASAGSRHHRLTRWTWA